MSNNNNHPNRRKSPVRVGEITPAHRAEMAALIERQRAADDRAMLLRVSGLSPFDAHRDAGVDECRRAIEDAHRFAVTTGPAIDTATGAVVGRVTWVSDSNCPHPVSDKPGRDAAISALVAEARASLDVLSELAADVDNGIPLFGMRGEAQYQHDTTAATIASLRRINVRPTDAFLDAIQAAADDVRQWTRSPHDANRMPQVDNQLNRLRAITYSGRGRHTLAARRAIDGDSVQMIIGAMAHTQPTKA